MMYFNEVILSAKVDSIKSEPGKGFQGTDRWRVELSSDQWGCLLAFMYGHERGFKVGDTVVIRGSIRAPFGPQSTFIVINDATVVVEPQPDGDD